MTDGKARALGECPTCGAECERANTPGEPCWGQVEAVDEVQAADGDTVAIHACKGHADAVAFGSAYVPRPTP